MCLTKGDTTTYTKQILFDKYEVLKPLGKGSFSTVYLVRHLSLDQERALKIYPKDFAPTLSDLKEARILKSLSHPGIPLIYDIENDAQNYYLIEEYVRGESLDCFLLHQKIISTDFYYMLCSQLCGIFSYLHSLSPSPIIYRDLKPEHMILSGMQIKLIDFNISAFLLTEKGEPADNNNLDHLGNAAFSAPESFTEDHIALSSDIYSIGMIMQYLSEYLEKPPSKNLKKIIQQATAPDPSLRFETVEELLRAITAEIQNNSSAHLVKKIAVAGSHHGCGSTHLAFSLVSVLNFLGISAVYYEKNEQNSLQNAAEYLKGMTEIEGYCYYRFFCGLPCYGPGIRISPQKADVCVYDYGLLTSDSPGIFQEDEVDLVLYITTSAVWEFHTLQNHMRLLQQTSIPHVLLCNFSTLPQAGKLSRFLSHPVFRYMTDPDPFLVTGQKVRLFRKILHLK